jgi:hypothetical protein
VPNQGSIRRHVGAPLGGIVAFEVVHLGRLEVSGHEAGVRGEAGEGEVEGYAVLRAASCVLSPES